MLPMPKSTHVHRVLNDPRAPQELKDRYTTRLRESGALGGMAEARENARRQNQKLLVGNDINDLVNALVTKVLDRKSLSALKEYIVLPNHPDIMAEMTGLNLRYGDSLKSAMYAVDKVRKKSGLSYNEVQDAICKKLDLEVRTDIAQSPIPPRIEKPPLGKIVELAPSPSV